MQVTGFITVIPVQRVTVSAQRGYNELMNCYEYAGQPLTMQHVFLEHKSALIILTVLPRSEAASGGL
jgi:hypothetical protein